MKLVLTLLLLVATPAALANSVTVCKDDQLLISSNSVHIISKDHETVKMSHNCDLNISPDSKVVVKNNGRRIVEESMIAIIVDKEKNYCEVESIIQV
jgi:hypothetical protein